MTNTLAIIIGVLLCGAVAIDVTLYGTEHLIFLARKMTELIEWMAFWR